MNVALQQCADEHDGALGNAKAALKRRRQRLHLLGSMRHVDGPAWDMLIDLFISHFEEQSVSVTALCVTAGVPMTSAVRVLGRLLRSGVVRRIPDQHDRRRHYVVLEEDALEALRRYFAPD